MSSYAHNREWSDKFIPAIKMIVGPLLMSVTPEEIDCEQAADLMVFTARDMKIAARVRRPGFADRYPYEFTIRAKLDSGAETELSKIVNGWGDWLFYGHDAGNGVLGLWWLIDLHTFRAALIRQATNGTRVKAGDKANGDGTYFKWFDLRSFPVHPPILIASSRQLTCWNEVAA